MVSTAEYSNSLNYSVGFSDDKSWPTTSMKPGVTSLAHIPKTPPNSKSVRSSMPGIRQTGQNFFFNFTYVPQYYSSVKCYLWIPEWNIHSIYFSNHWNLSFANLTITWVFFYLYNIVKKSTKNSDNQTVNIKNKDFAFLKELRVSKFSELFVSVGYNKWQHSYI